jgi:hypothetical protein
LCARRVVGYDGAMSTHPDEERPLDLGGTPAEEGVSPADASERAGLTPEEQENRVDAPDVPEEGVDP